MVKGQFKLLTAIAVSCLLTAPAYAECYYSSQTIAQVPYKVDDIDHVSFMHGPGHCTVTARVLYKGQWNTIAGKASHQSKQPMDICDDALSYAIKDFLLRSNGHRIDAEQHMICTDLPTTQLRPVDKGEVIRLSEVQPHPTRGAFIRNGNECRWFIEPEVDHLGRMHSINGVICKVGRLNADQWYVIGKRLD